MNGADVLFCSQECQVPDPSPQSPLALATSDEPACTSGTCSQCYLVLCFLGRAVFLPRENLLVVLWNPSLEDGEDKWTP